MKKYLLIGFFGCFAVFLSAQNADIISNLAAPNDSGATVIVHQDEAINYFLVKKSVDATEKLTKGWTVQVFSENSQNAKDEAFAIEKKIRAKFPNEDVRSERISPFWKVRVGKFAETDAANTLKELLIKEFPEYKGGIYIVKFTD
ncbi:MAG: SPOR domain-containing protein [Prevotellaceae bacterium]|jgi:hypothetical protein|nr:SPOR domain-containing protein [Prevotellaceae bacterium]